MGSDLAENRHHVLIFASSQRHCQSMLPEILKLLEITTLATVPLELEPGRIVESAATFIEDKREELIKEHVQ